MPRQPMIADISTLFNQTSWSAEPLPRNANGKLMKRLLRDRLTAA